MADSRVKAIQSTSKMEVRPESGMKHDEKAFEEYLQKDGKTDAEIEYIKAWMKGDIEHAKSLESTVPNAPAPQIDEEKIRKALREKRRVRYRLFYQNTLGGRLEN